MHDMPTPSQILEELAEKAAIQIERNAPVAFDNALNEMSRYHRFLLQLNAAVSTDGQSFNFSEISGNGWRTPHEEWIGHYRRLFERAANRIPIDDHFMRSLTYAPHKLLPGKDDMPISREVTKGIIDLGPLMMFMIENWVTQQSEKRRISGDELGEHRAMAGSYTSAYSDFLPHAIGAWEHLLLQATFLHCWDEAKHTKAESQWRVYQNSWPFLWQHLICTARCLCISVWNEDEIGAKFFREALVGWMKNLSHHLTNTVGVELTLLPYPDIMSLNWPEAKSLGDALRPRMFQNLEAPSPLDLFSNTVKGAFDDVLLLTSTILLSWSSCQKQPSDIGARTALALLQRKTEERQRSLKPIRFRNLFLQATRLNLAGERWEESSYGASLDRLVASLDRMTERVVVPGRPYTPSTFHSRNELLPVIASILAANVSIENDDGLEKHFSQLVKVVDLLPDGDSSLRGLLEDLSSMQKVLAEKPEELVLGTRSINPECDVDSALTCLSKIVETVEATIRGVREKRLRNTPIDRDKMRSIQTAMQNALEDSDGYELYFHDFEVQLNQEVAAPTEQCARIPNVNKASLTNPPLEPPGLNLESTLASSIRQFAGDFVWIAFAQQQRTKKIIDFDVIDEKYWEAIKPLVEEIGANPVLLVSSHDEESKVSELRFASEDEFPNLEINYKQDSHFSQRYLATIEGVDVYSADFPSGTAWLFSAQKLKSVRYSEIGDDGHCVELSFEPDDDFKGTLKACFLQQIEWSVGEIFEITTPSPATTD